MEDKTAEAVTAEARSRPTTTTAPAPATKTERKQAASVQHDARCKCKKKQKRKHVKQKSSSKKKAKEDPDTDGSTTPELTDSDRDQDSTDSEDDEESCSESESDGDKRARRRKKQKDAKERRRKNKARAGRNQKKQQDSSESEPSSDDSSDESSGEREDAKAQASNKPAESQARKGKSKKHAKDDEPASGGDSGSVDLGQLQAQLRAIEDKLAEASAAAPAAADPSTRSTRSTKKSRARDAEDKAKSKAKSKSKSKEKSKSGKNRRRSTSKRGKPTTKLEFKRVDELWDETLHNFKLTDTVEEENSDEYEQYVFTVRRQFDWKGKYTDTFVDIKSPLLKEALQEVMDGIKGVSLVEESPTVDPNMLFLYLEELRTLRKQLKKRSLSEKKGKVRKRCRLMAGHVKVLVKYLDADYSDTKKTLYPLMESNLITSEFLWALFKPNTIAYTTTYGSSDEPRAFKVEYASKESSFQRGTWYNVEGRYLEYDGKSFGMGTLWVDVDCFKGSRKISSLAAYPMKYHKDQAGIQKQLIERGRKFVALGGMNYRFHKGMAFYKKKRNVGKVNINGRIMIDSAIHRRINPNYPVSPVRPNEDEEDGSQDGSECDSSCCCGQETDDGDTPADADLEEMDDPDATEEGGVFDSDGKLIHASDDGDSDEDDVDRNKLLALDDPDKADREFTDEELMLASPVVLGFAFSEKLWLEFTVSGVKEIEWNLGAFDSLVLPENQKSIVKALVESHTFHAAQNIEDVIQGKGKGLVAVLHGPPGTGKTLTAEGIAELLKRPLYMVSAGELGTDPRMLEAELNKLLDLSHSWGAVLLLDEADVFLEKRTIQDIHRNALVSIFLRLLEYFQGILFLTTNRVETFDDAFQSRIHVALRYGELNTKAKKAVWKLFIDRVKAKEGLEVEDFTESDLDALARNHLNGRQIKNCVRTAQALAANNAEKLAMHHIRRVLDVVESFDRELKGGTGYVDAMRSYT
ncbi:MAG: hypothetical protein M1826_002914 [Phylliscum demangeonii]|nr:MAG: hypothetical protein M1826_002914 [Phylliscum demangeonii]